MRILFIYPPFAPPTMFPYSVTNLYSYISKNFEAECKILDLNAAFHRLRFNKYYETFAQSATINSAAKILSEFNTESKKAYAENNLLVRKSEDPEYFSELMHKILEFSPDIAVISVVYNNQVFYAFRLADALKKQGINCVCGGPAVSHKLPELCNFLSNKEELFDHLISLGAQLKDGSDRNSDVPLDFSIYSPQDYLCKEKIIPVKTQESCFYRGCAFCTHHGKQKHRLLDLTVVEKTLRMTDVRYVYFIDDMFSKQRLIEVAAMMKLTCQETGRKIRWMVNLRPTKDFIDCDFAELRAAGLVAIAWGFESGSQRILNLMRKGTNISDVSVILKKAHDAEIKNILYTMFGFPTETKAEFLETIAFLKTHSESIDLVSTSVFGLQKGSFVYAHPELFGIRKISLLKRELLDPQVVFDLASENCADDASSGKAYFPKDCRVKYKKTIDSINKMPKVFNVFKEQVLLVN